VTPILGIFDSAKSGNLYQTSYDSISTQTVSSLVSSVTFSSIPQTYTHLQLRILAKTSRGAGPDILCVRYNGDTGNNYADHLIYGDGSTVSPDKDTSYPQQNIHRVAADDVNASIFSPFVIDIFDYTNTNKFKTLRSLGGYDANGSGRIAFGSGLWQSTSAISSITLFSAYAESWKPNTQFALYGLKVA